MKNFRYIIACLIYMFYLLPGNSQTINEFRMEDFTLSGNAEVSGDHCFQLTSEDFWQRGAVWFKNRIDLNSSFHIEMDVNLGCIDEGGADGIVFIFHPWLRTGRAGEGMGFSGLYPSFGVEMDTYQNPHLNDPVYDHIAFMSNGMPSHFQGLTDPVPIKPKMENVEDCRNHRVEIKWDAKTKTIEFYFDGSLRQSLKIDLVSEIFRGNSDLYWGFAAATGNKLNRHLVCIEKLEFKKSFTFNAFQENELLIDKYTMTNWIFNSANTALTEEAKQELREIARIMKNNPTHTLFIEAFTDSQGSTGSNENISEERATAAKAYLMDLGIEEYKIKSKGQGAKNPIAPNNTSAGRTKNRRIELKLRILRV